MPSRHATKKGRMNGTACKLNNLSRSSADVERAVMGTNEDTVFGRVTKMWGNGHCQVLAYVDGARVQLHKVRIPKTRLGKKGATPITLNSTVTIFVGKSFEAAKVRDTDAFDINALLDDKQVRALVKQQLAPSWFLKSADEITSTEPTTAVEEEGFDWDTSADESVASAEDVATLTMAKDASEAMTKKQLREIKKAADKIAAGKKIAQESEFEAWDTARMVVEAEPVAKNSSDAWIDRI